jgi:hypothetical protein
MLKLVCLRLAIAVISVLLLLVKSEVHKMVIKQLKMSIIAILAVEKKSKT